MDHYQLIQNQHRNIMMKINLIYLNFFLFFLEDEFLLYRLDIMINQLHIQLWILPLQNLFYFIQILIIQTTNECSTIFIKSISFIFTFRKSNQINNQLHRNIYIMTSFTKLCKEDKTHLYG